MFPLGTNEHELTFEVTVSNLIKVEHTHNFIEFD